MKKTFLFLAALLLALPAAAFAAGPAEISVTGTASVAMQPNVATVNANVQTFAASVTQAISDNNARYDRIVAALGKAGVARGDIALSYYNVNYETQPRTGYTVSRDFSIKVRDIGKAGEVTDAATAAGATSINGVNFGLLDASSAKGEATERAVQDARRQADLIASAAHLHVIGIKSIDLGGGGGIVVPQPLMRAATMNAPTQFDQSDVNVTVNVSVTFLATP